MSSNVRERSSINNSTSKQQFAFPRSMRFVAPKQHTKAFGYEVKEGFGKKKDDAAGRGFGSSCDRWGYE